MKLGIDLKDASTYSGLIALVGGTSELISYVMPSSLSHLVQPISMVVIAVSGLVFTFTKDYAKTPSKVDDVIHDIAGALSSKED